MISLNWDTYADTDCDSFNVYRSVPGFILSYPNDLSAGDVLTFSATDGAIQNITFSAVDIDSVVAIFNDAALGVVATKIQAGTAIIFRITATANPKLKLYACTFLTDADIEAPSIIVPDMNFTLIGNVVTVDNTTNYSFSDPDGTQYDSYEITSVTDSVESLPSIVQSPLIGTDILCVVEGRFCDSQNRPVVGLKINAQVSTQTAYADGRGIYGDAISATTDEYGRFSIALTQNTVYLLSIPDVGYNWNVCIPALPSTEIVYLVPSTEADFSPFGDPQ